MLSATWLVGALSALASAQCINTLAKYHPHDRTLCYNGTWFLVSMDKAAVQSMVPHPLLPLPTADKSLFPQGFPANKHLVIVQSNLGNDIRQFNLEIDELNAASILVPYVNRVQGSGVPFNYPTEGYIGGAGKQLAAGIIPGLVGTVEGNTLYQATFDPPTSAYQALGGGTFSTSVKQVIVPNPLSGPGVVPTVIDMKFQTIAPSQSPFTKKLFVRALNQAQILNNGIQCQYNLVAVNETFSNPQFRQGEVTLYNLDGSLKNYFTGQYGFSSVYEEVGLPATTCDDAAKAYQSTLNTGL